ATDSSSSTVATEWRPPGLLDLGAFSSPLTISGPAPTDLQNLPSTAARLQRPSGSSSPTPPDQVRTAASVAPGGVITPAPTALLATAAPRPAAAPARNFAPAAPAIAL